MNRARVLLGALVSVLGGFVSKSGMFLFKGFLLGAVVFILGCGKEASREPDPIAAPAKPEKPVQALEVSTTMDVLIDETGFFRIPMTKGRESVFMDKYGCPSGLFWKQGGHRAVDLPFSLDSDTELRIQFNSESIATYDKKSPELGTVFGKWERKKKFFSADEKVKYTLSIQIADTEGEFDQITFNTKCEKN